MLQILEGRFLPRNIQTPRQHHGVIGAAAHKNLLPGNIADNLVNPLRPVSGWRSLSPEMALRMTEVLALYAETEDRRWVDQLRLPQVDGGCEECVIGYGSPFRGGRPL